jgi:hypothetical protein
VTVHSARRKLTSIPTSTSTNRSPSLGKQGPTQERSKATLVLEGSERALLFRCPLVDNSLASALPTVQPLDPTKPPFPPSSPAGPEQAANYVQLQVFSRRRVSGLPVRGVARRLEHHLWLSLPLVKISFLVDDLPIIGRTRKMPPWCSTPSINGVLCPTRYLPDTTTRYERPPETNEEWAEALRM